MSVLRRIGIAVGFIGAAVCLGGQAVFVLNNPAMTSTQLFLDGTTLLWSMGALVFASLGCLCWSLESEDDSE